MPYCTQADVELAVGGPAALVELCDLREEGATSGATNIAVVVAAAIEEADGYINSYLHQRFAVPINPVAPEIRAMSRAWSCRVIRRGRYKGQIVKEDLDAEIVDRKWLEKLAGGLCQLSVQPTAPASDIVIDKVCERDTSFTISKKRLRGFI